MSLFGSSPATKPMFSTTATTSANATFSFGGSSATTAAPSLFGSTTTSTAKPLFGTATQASSTPSLFGSTATSAPSTGLFGATAATTASTGLFGSTTTSTPSTGLFGATTTAATQPSLFGGATTTPSTGGLFGGTSTTGGLFGSKPAGTTFGSTGTTFGSTTGGGLFGAKPAGSTGLFGAAAQQPQQQMRDTLQTVFQNSDALVRSITNPELYGDDRDKVIAKLNQLAAALGVGSGLYKQDQPGVAYNQDGPFYQYQAVGYNRVSEHADSDGVVSMVVKQPQTEFVTQAQRQKFVDGLFAVLGSKPGLHAKIESVRALPDNCTEVVVYVTEKGRGRISSKELCQFFNQQAQKTQLETQMKVDPTRIVSRVKMDPQMLEEYLRDTPLGIEPRVWQQAARENPDPKRLVPVVVRGFEQLRARQMAQAQEVTMQNRVLESVGNRADQLEKTLAMARSHAEATRAKHKELSFRLLRMVCAQLGNSRYTQPLDAAEDHMQGALETINAMLNAPGQLKDRVTEVMDQIQSTENQSTTNGTGAQQGTGESSSTLSEADMLQLKRYLARCQDGLESLTRIVNCNLKDLKVMTESLT